MEKFTFSRLKDCKISTDFKHPVQDSEDCKRVAGPSGSTVLNLRIHLHTNVTGL